MGLWMHHRLGSQETSTLSNFFLGKLGGGSYLVFITLQVAQVLLVDHLASRPNSSWSLVRNIQKGMYKSSQSLQNFSNCHFLELVRESISFPSSRFKMCHEWISHFSGNACVALLQIFQCRQRSISLMLSLRPESCWGHSQILGTKRGLHWECCGLCPV